MILDRVTVTGADNSIKATDLIPLTHRFPFVEWGILFSKSSEGTTRFPTANWIEELWNIRENNPSIRLSGHICGRWVRDICEGNWSISNDRPTFMKIFQRFQLNFHAQVHSLRKLDFLAGIKPYNDQGYEFIFQMDDVNNSLLHEARDLGINASPLFDLSGGAGILPYTWPKAEGFYTGYAGGLSPDNVAEQLEKIKLVAGDSRIWIDVERRVRSEDDSQFDLDKVARFLEAAEPYVTK
jgi:phosphoribosylanthranilate isomerase